MRHPVGTSLWILFTLFIVYGTTIPFNFSSEAGWAAHKFAAMPLNPFVAPDTGRRVSIPDFVQNVLLFAPFGVLGVLRLRAGGRSRVAALMLVIALGTILSAGIETLQLWTIDRVSSVSDVVANTCGAIAGAVGALAGETSAIRLLKRFARSGVLAQPALYPALVAAIVVVIAAWEPFDATLDVSSVYGKFKALAHDPWQAGPLSDEGIASVQYVLFVWALGNLLAGMRVHRPAVLTALVGVVAAVGLESCQIIIGSRMPSLEDATVRAVAALVGVALWQSTREWHRPLLWFAVLSIAVALSAAMQMWTPFEISATYHSFGWFPFLDYYEHTTFETVSHVIELLLLYFPLGFCACLTITNRVKAAGIGLLVAAAIAVPVEYMQGWLVGRYPDVTDAALGVAGAVLGLIAGGYGARLFAETVRGYDALTDLC